MTLQDDFALYIYAGRQLRHSVRANKRDYEAAQRGRKLRYFADANIVSLFMDPTRDRDVLSAFANWLPNDILLSTLTATAEFMFSGTLPGQNGDPIFITPDHFEDLYSMAMGIQTRGQVLSDNITVADAEKNKDRVATINGLIDDYKKKKKLATELLKDLEVLLPGAITQTLMGPVVEARQLRRLFDNNLAARADGAEWFHREVLQPDESVVSACAINMRPFARRSRIKRTEANLLRDARSLVQLIELGNSAAAGVDYIFISTDLAMRNVFNEYLERERKAGRPSIPLYFRQPREFVPLLNLASMSGHAGMVGLFPRIEKALDELLIGVSVGESIPERPQDVGKGIETSAAYVGARSQLDVGFNLEKRISDLRNIWVQAATTALTVNSAFITRRDEVHFATIEEVLNDPDLIRAARHQLRRTVDKLSTAHVFFAFRGAVARFLERARERGGSEREFLSRRAPLQIKNNIFRDLIGDITINDFLDNLYRSGDQGDLLVKLSRAANPELLFLFGSCVALVAEDWRSAHSFAEYAYYAATASRAPNPTLLDEARYCCALSTRFVMRSKREFETALDHLKKSREYAEGRNDSFGKMRASSEAAALIYVFLYRKRLAPIGERGAFEPIRFDALWKECSLYLTEVDEILDGLPLEMTGEDMRLYLRVELQAAAVRAGLVIYLHWLTPNAEQLSNAEIERQKEALRKLDSAIDDWTQMVTETNAPYTGRVFANVLRFILARDDGEKAKARLAAKQLLTRLLKHESSMFDFDVTQYKYFLTRLQS